MPAWDTGSEAGGRAAEAVASGAGREGGAPLKGVHQVMFDVNCNLRKLGRLLSPHISLSSRLPRLWGFGMLTRRSALALPLLLALALAALTVLFAFGGAPEAQAQDGGAPPVSNLRCIAETDFVAFIWVAPEWSGGEVASYDYRLSLPDGRTESGNVKKAPHSKTTLLRRSGDYPSAQETRLSLKANWERAGGGRESSAETTLSCRVRRGPERETPTPPAAPGNLQATVIADGVRLTWDAPADQASVVTGYEVLRRESGQSGMMSYVLDTGSTVTSYTDRGAAKQGETYTYQVKARVGKLSARASNSAAVTIPGTCPVSGGSPVDVPISEVPIVVASTTADYFVLYVRPDLDGDLEIPVSVTLGQDGTTTLTEQLAALPKAHYRVEKYRTANPADVDGDCIDDITELQDLGTKNPVNPAKAIDIRDGTVAIPDRETFERLSQQGDLDQFADLEFVKFYLFNTGPPMVYFMNTATHRAHYRFIERLRDQNIGVPANSAMRGELVYHPNVVASDGSLGVYRFQFQATDAYSFERIAHANEALAASMPFLENNLAYHPLSQARYESEKALYGASRVNVLLERDILPDVDFISLNQGEGYGFLRIMPPEERPNPRDIVIYEALPNDLPRVAGIVTTVPQTPLSHVNLRAVQDDIPNAFIRDALDGSYIDDLIGSHVRYQVTRGGYTLRAATKAEVDAHYESSRPAEAQTPERDLSVTKITALSDVGFDDWDAFGVKAANVAVLGTLNFPEGTVPGGFAVPFYFYDEFMKNAALAEETLFGKKKWAEEDKFTLPAGTKLRAVVTAMLAHRKFQADYEVQEEMLDDLRDAIKDAASPQWIIDALTAMHATYPEGQSLRYRSSTNNEDLPGYSGAGLYDSKTQDPEETTEDGIDKSIKGVWASLWNFRAFVERDFHRIDHTKTAMGVLVHPNYSLEKANGVAVSFNPVTNRDGAYYVNTQLGEDLITNPEAHSRPEEILLLPGGEYEVLVRSNLTEQVKLLMSDAQMKQLRSHLEVIHAKFSELYDASEGEPFAMDIEFKITSANKLSIKQARPWVFARSQQQATPNQAPTVASAIADATIASESGTRTVSLSRVFSDSLTVTASSSDETKATVSVASDYSTLTVTAKARGTATITVTANDGNGGTVDDAFTVTVKASPVVALALADVTDLDVAATRDVSLSGVFSDADGDSLTVSAASSDETKATVSVASDYATLTVAGVAQGTATITVTAQDSDGNSVSDNFDVAVTPPTEEQPQQQEGNKYADLIAQMYDWRNNDPQWSSVKAHTDRWDRALLAFGETVSDASITPMTAAEAQALADQNWGARWVPVAKALWEIEGNQAPTVASALPDVTIVRESGTHHVSLSGVFDDADGDSLTATAASSDEAVATVSVAADQSSLTVSAQARGTATVTVTADDGKVGAAEDSFTVTVKAAPVVASALAGVRGLEAGKTQHVSLSGVFGDADGDALTITAASSNDNVATVAVASDYSTLTVAGVAQGTATVTVTARDADGNRVNDQFEVSVAAPQQQQQQQDPPPNRAPTVSRAIADAAIVNESGTHQVSLSGVFSDADNDSLTVTAASSDEATATVSVASDYSSLTVTAQARGTATITVTANDGNGGTVSDSFAVRVKAAPTVASAIADVSLQAGGSQDVSLSGVFSDADGESLTVTTDTSDENVANAFAFQETLTVTAFSAGSATITVTAQDRDGNRVSDSFAVTVTAAPPPNRAPTVSAAIGDVTIVNQGGTRQVSLSGVFSDADNDSLTVTAGSSNAAVAAVSVAGNYATLTVSAQSRGTATVTVTASDGNGGTVSDAFTVTVKAAPVVASAIADVSGLETDAMQDVSLAGVFSDADGDALTITAASSDDAKATVNVAADQSTLTVAGVAEGTATITVTAQDTDGNQVIADFAVSVVEPDDQPTGAPTVAVPLPDFSLEGHEHKEFDLDDVFHDPDGDELKFSAMSSNYNVATMWVDGSTLVVVGTGTGTATITVTAEDPDGNTVSDDFEVTARPLS